MYEGSLDNPALLLPLLLLLLCPCPCPPTGGHLHDPQA